MITELYADSASAIHVTGNMIRIDLMSLQPHLKGESGEPVFELSGRLILPLDGFIQAFQLQENIIKQLMNNGILVRQTDEQGKTINIEGSVSDQKDVSVQNKIL